MTIALVSATLSQTFCVLSTPHLGVEYGGWQWGVYKSYTIFPTEKSRLIAALSTWVSNKYICDTDLLSCSFFFFLAFSFLFSFCVFVYLFGCDKASFFFNYSNPVSNSLYSPGCLLIFLPRSHFWYFRYGPPWWTWVTTSQITVTVPCWHRQPQFAGHSRAPVSSASFRGFQVCSHAAVGNSTHWAMCALLLETPAFLSRYEQVDYVSPCKVKQLLWAHQVTQTPFEVTTVFLALITKEQTYQTGLEEK